MNPAAAFRALGLVGCAVSLLSVTPVAQAQTAVAADGEAAAAAPLAPPTTTGAGIFSQSTTEATTAGLSDAGLPLPAFLAAGGALDSPTPDLVVTLGAGVKVSPAYFGSDQYETGPTGIARIDYLRFPNGFEYGSGAAVGFRTGLGLRGSVRYISERKSSDYSEINGLDNVPWTFEAGFGLGYEQRNYRVFGDVRYGIIGSNAWVGDLGADAIAYPVDGLTLTLGPRLNFGSTNFTDTYFGISASESTASGLPQYDASGGLISGGVVLGARYLFNERWGVEGEASWERLVNDAADSPITALGSNDQYSVKLNLTRRISLDF